MADPTLEQIAAELYALPLDAFTAERNVRAAAAGDRAAADGIRALRKPSLAAWVVDLLARREADDLAAAFDVGAAMREAQEELDADTLTALTKQRRALVAGLARRAVALAAAEGVGVSRAAADEVEKTLNTAMRDAAAADAVMTARLVRTLDVVGFDPADLDGAVGGAVPARPPSPRRDDLAERRARRAAERAAREAAQAASAAERELARADTVLTTARERAEHVQERVEDLRAELERLQADAVRAADAAASAQSARDDAAKRAKKARTAADAAATVIEDGTDGG